MISRAMELSERSRGLALTLAAAVAVLVVAPAQACQYEFAPEPIGGPSARFIMPRMFNAASFVDLVIAEGSQELSSLPGIPQGHFPEAHSFRVIQRWKGNSTDRFILIGSKGDGRPEWTITHWTDEKGRIYPYMSVREAETGSLMALTSCSPPTLAPKLGSLHIVFREADGRLLGAVPYHADMRPVAGTSIAEVGALWLESDVAREAQAGGAHADMMKLSPPPQVPDPQRATLRFRKPLSGSAVKALLAGSGAVPFSVTLVRGGRTMDYRLGAAPPQARLIDDAIAWAERTGTPRPPLITHTRTLIDAYPLYSLGGELEFAR